MKKGDFLWGLCLFAIIFILLMPSTRSAFTSATKAHPYIMGFIKVAILAMMGELLALRILIGDWKKPIGFFWRMVIWGIFGMAFAVIFPVFDAGIHGAIKGGLLPGFQNSGLSRITTPLFISTFMNIAFAPMMMGLHRITDTYIELCEGKLEDLKAVKLQAVVEHIDWVGLVGFVYFKTIPFFWIPAHTITFLLPPEYRVLMASFLSIALGGILAFSKKKNVQSTMS